MPKIPLGLNARSFLPLSNALNWRTGAIGGAALGGASGLLRDPGVNPDGTPKSRLGAAAKGAIGGAAVGGGVGALNTKFVQPKLMKSVYGDNAPRVQAMQQRMAKMKNTADEKLVTTPKMELDKAGREALDEKTKAILAKNEGSRQVSPAVTSSTPAANPQAPTVQSTSGAPSYSHNPTQFEVPIVTESGAVNPVNKSTVRAIGTSPTFGVTLNARK
jgi:hypothetical protein